MNGRNPVTDHRIGEHVRTVSQRGDDEFVGRRELGAKGRPEAPAEPAGGAERESAGLLAHNDPASEDIR